MARIDDPGDEADDDAREDQARQLNPAQAAPCPNGHRAGADGEKKAEIVRVGSKYARESQSYDCSDGRSVVELVSDEVKASAGDDRGQKQEQGIGARLLSVSMPPGDTARSTMKAIRPGPGSGLTPAATATVRIPHIALSNRATTSD